jgi:alkanesulfonate monooxygenase SsuD/methylene tetrahydromethanopterin reductase-like flavin-dependent oxidoreductase (luciferase family)
MKVSMFHLMPHRELPADFEQRYESVWVTPPWWELANAERVGQYYNWTLDELVYAAKAGLDGVCTNEHHQNAYGFMPSPNLMGSALAKLTNGLEVAIVQMGSTLATTIPPIRVAEEYAMLDCLSGGRLVAGMPLGTSMDTNLCYGIPPIEVRERYREAHDLVLKAWQAKELFAWNGQYFQLPLVNPWPRPIQQPHPPVWVPGSGTLSTWEYVIDNGHCYCYLSYFGAKAAERLVDGYWEVVEQKRCAPNPYRLGFLQLVAVSESDARAAAEYAPHVEYFYHKCLHVPSHYFMMPGYQDYASMLHAMKAGMGSRAAIAQTNLKELSYKDFDAGDYVIAGSPATVRERLRAAIQRLRVGNLMVLLHIGSMPHDLTLKNIDLFCREVLPSLHDVWDDQWENHWWPARLRASHQPAGAPGRGA